MARNWGTNPPTKWMMSLVSNHPFWRVFNCEPFAYHMYPYVFIFSIEPNLCPMAPILFRLCTVIHYWHCCSWTKSGPLIGLVATSCWKWSIENTIRWPLCIVDWLYMAILWICTLQIPCYSGVQAAALPHPAFAYGFLRTVSFLPLFASSLPEAIKSPHHWTSRPELSSTSPPLPKFIQDHLQETSIYIYIYIYIYIISIKFQSSTWVKSRILPIPSPIPSTPRAPTGASRSRAFSSSRCLRFSMAKRSAFSARRWISSSRRMRFSSHFRISWDAMGNAMGNDRLW